MKRSALLTMMFAFGLTAIAQDGKAELRYALKKGEKVAFALTFGMSVKLDKVPELLQGVVSEDPIDVKFEGVVDMEVTEVADDGTARLNGTWRTAKAKGHVMVNDIDFNYDVNKKGDDKPKKQDAEDPALAGFGDLQDHLATMVKTPLKLAVDGLGKVSVVEGSGKLGEIESVFRSLNGFMGPLPKNKVGKGDSWKDELKLAIPGLGGNVELKIRSENLIDSLDKVEGKDVYVIKSKYAVGKLPGEKEDAPAGDVQVKLKTDGEGEGKTLFSLSDGRALKSTNTLRVKLNAIVPNPGGGEDLDIKAQFKVESGHSLK